MVDYHYPAWRRVVFVIVLVLVLSMVVLPPLAKGTVNLRIYSFSTPSAVEHIYLKLSQVELHTIGFPRSGGWIALRDSLPRLDIASQPGQLNPNSVYSAPIQSGRYDAIRISLSEASFGTNSTSTSQVCTVCPQLLGNATISVPPGGYGDVLVVLGIDYSSLLATPASFSPTVMSVTSR